MQERGTLSGSILDSRILLICISEGSKIYTGEMKYSSEFFIHLYWRDN